MTAVFRAESKWLFWWSWVLQASNIRSQRQPRRLLNYMRYELNQRLRTHSCGQDLTPSRLRKKKGLKGKEVKSPLKSVLSEGKLRMWLWFFWQQESDWLQISVPAGLYKCLRFQRDCMSAELGCKDLSKEGGKTSYDGGVTRPRFCLRWQNKTRQDRMVLLWFFMSPKFRVDQTTPLKLMENRSRRRNTRIVLHWPRDYLMSLCTNILICFFFILNQQLSLWLIELSNK